MPSPETYMPMQTPGPSKACTSNVEGGPSPSGVKVMVSLPGPFTAKSVARYWSPYACLCQVHQAVPCE